MIYQMADVAMNPRQTVGTIIGLVTRTIRVPAGLSRPGRSETIARYPQNRTGARSERGPTATSARRRSARESPGSRSKECGTTRRDAAPKAPCLSPGCSGGNLNPHRASRPPAKPFRAANARARRLLRGQRDRGLLPHRVARAYTDMLAIALRRRTPRPTSPRSMPASAATRRATPWPASIATCWPQADARHRHVRPERHDARSRSTSTARISPRSSQVPGRRRRGAALHAEQRDTTPGRPAEHSPHYCDAVREVGRRLNVPVCDVYADLGALRQARRRWPGGS